ncbi:hypothetical protein, partial [Pseudoalteromonas sp.]|uniref:hypothetical protein n=1 Tax=Pseudoalteromonas sp. TaxID=53249 RepID=UPI0023549720
KNPKGSACLAFMLRYRLFMGNNHTTQALPCLNTKQSAAKSITKGQHALAIPTYCTVFEHTITIIS